MNDQSLYILVVEDQQSLALNIADYMEQKGHVLDFASQGEQGLSLALTNQYDVVILDLNLPVMDGLEVCKQLREQATHHVPIIMLTARDSVEDKITGFTQGADDYLTKPADTLLIAQTLLGKENMEQEELPKERMSAERLEWEHIQQVLKANEGNVSETARQLNMHRRTLQRKLQKKPVQK